VPPPVRSGRGLPRWIPVVGLVLVLLVVAGAISALSNGGEDKAVAPVAATKKPAPKKKAQTTQSQTTPAQTQTTQSQSQTTPAPAGGDPGQMQLQAHNLINQGKYDEAIALDKQIVAKGPSTGLTYAYALYDLGHALRLAGRPDEAIPVLQERMKIDNQRETVKAELKQAQKDAKGKG
jgi:serine/threonine-protein kinase